MFSVAVCDDEERVCEQIKELIVSYGKKQGLSLHVDKYDSGESLCLAFEGQYDIVILDIEMKKMNGLELAGRLRQMSGEVVIIFSTSHRQYALDSYEVEASGYMIKPVTDKKLEKELNKAFMRVREHKTDFTIRFNGEVRMISLSQLLYVEVYRHKLIYHLPDGTELRGSGSLRDVKKEDKKNCLVQTHKSFLVNMMWIEGYRQKDNLVFVKGKSEGIPISRYRFTEFVDIYMEYCRRKLTGRGEEL